MAPRRLSNRASLDRMLRRLRADDRIDELREVFATAARTCAAEVDAACAPDSDVASYARGRIIGPYLRALEALSEHVRPIEETDAWAELLGRSEWAEFVESTGPRWDAIEKSVGDVKPGDAFPLVDE
jgi:hypothetical protein